MDEPVWNGKVLECQTTCSQQKLHLCAFVILLWTTEQASNSVSNMATLTLEMLQQTYSNEAMSCVRCSEWHMCVLLEDDILGPLEVRMSLTWAIFFKWKLKMSNGKVNFQKKKKSFKSLKESSSNPRRIDSMTAKVAGGKDFMLDL